MKDFSNETKKVRRNAILKVILKRYSFIVWLPLLIYISYYIGKFTILIGNGKISDSCGYIGKILITIILGILGTLALCIIISILFVLSIIIDKDFFKSAGKILLQCIKEIPNGLIIILKIPLKIPIYLYKRIKDEKRRFQNAVEDQINKDHKKNLSKDIEN